MACTALYSINSPRAILSKQISNKLPTELQYVKRSVLMKEMNTQKIWTFEFGIQEIKNVSIQNIIGFSA